MSLQIAILKVLASHPGGHASTDAMKSDLAVLAASGREWSDRVKRLADRAPNLDIFGQRYVLHDRSGWTIVDAGRDFLRSIERSPAPERPAPRPAQQQVRRTDYLLEADRLWSS